MADLGELDYLLKKDEDVDPNAGGVIAPIQGAQVAAKPVGLYTDEQRAALAKAAYDGAMNPNADVSGPGGKGELASTKPDWFQNAAPPQKSTGLGLADAGLNALAAGRQKWADTAAQNPLRSMALKQGDQAAATRASILGGLMNLLANKPQADFNAQQDAALKQAQMYRVLHPAGGRGSQGASATAALGADTRIRELTSREQLNAEKAAKEQRLNDPTSPESIELQRIAVATHQIAPEAAGSYSYNALLKEKPALMQVAHEDWRGAEADRQLQNRNAEEIEKANRAQITHAQQQKMAEEQRQAEAALPGRQWVGAAPDVTTVNKARDMHVARNLLKESAGHLAEDQAKLEQMGIIAAAGGNYTPVEGVAVPKEAQAIIEDAKKWQRTGSDAYRQAAHFGTLTGKDKELADEMVTQVGTPTGYLIGPASWNALSDVVDKSVETQLRQMGSVPQGEKVAGNPILTTPAEQRIHEFKVPTKVPYSRNPQVSLNEDGETSAAPAAGGASPEGAKPVGNYVGVFSLTSTDANGNKIQSTPRPLTQEQYDKLSDDVKKRLVRMQ